MATMTVTTHADGLHVRYPYHPAVVERLKAISGAAWDKVRGVWIVPLAQADKLMDAFPLATFDYAAIGAACDAEQQRGAVFAACLAAWGIALRVVGAAPGALVAEGASVSPLIQELVTARAADLRRYVGLETQRQNHACVEKTGAGIEIDASHACSDTETQEAPENGLSVEATEFDRLFFRSIQNAARREQEQAAQGRGRHPRRKAKPVQGELFHAT